jgi:hypothetical protein
MTSSLVGRPPTSYNVFDSSFNNIDSNGNWSLKSKSIFSDGNITIDPSNTLFVDGNVGIGTTTINDALDVSGNANISNYLSFSTNQGVRIGQTNQGENSIAIGVSAGQGTQSSNSIAIGSSAGQTGQGTQSIAIGLTAGQGTHKAKMQLLLVIKQDKQVKVVHLLLLEI